MTSLPRSDLTSSTHFEVFMKEVRSVAKAGRSRGQLRTVRAGHGLIDSLVMSYTTTATEESRM